MSVDENDHSAPGEIREKRSAKYSEMLDIADLEKRVHFAELRAREAEAEVRYIEASAKRKELKGVRKDRMKSGKKNGDGRKGDRE